MRYFGLLLILISISSKGQLKPTAEIKGQFKFFTTDKLGNIFAITSKNDIQKFDKMGKKISEVNFKVLDEASFIDASNPMEVYVLYKDQNKMVYFDNMLNLRGETDLYKTLGVNNIQVVCRSYDNGLWFFDPDNYRLKKSDKSGAVQSESVNLSALVDTVLNPEMLIEDGKFVYLKVAPNQLMVFDILGNYIKNVVLEKFNSFQIRQDEIIYSIGYDLVRYNPQTFVKISILGELESFAGKAYSNIRLEEDQIYTYDAEGIYIFHF